jgi:hypothetical protein
MPVLSKLTLILKMPSGQMVTFTSVRQRLILSPTQIHSPAEKKDPCPANHLLTYSYISAIM